MVQESTHSTKTYTTRDLSLMYGVTIQTVSRWVRKCCKDQGVELSSFGLVDPTDARVRRFSEQDVQILRGYIPDGKNGAIDAEIVDTTETIEVSHRKEGALGLFDFSNVRPQNLNIAIVNVQELQDQATDFDQMRGAALKAIGAFIGQDALNTATQLVAENRHALKGFAASGVNDALGGLGGDRKGKKK